MMRQRDGERRTAERGSAAVPFAIALPVMIGVMGLAIDLAYMYSRHNELQQLADTVALGAARRLNGTLAGVVAARNEANGLAWAAPFNFHDRIVWNNAALSFAASEDGPEWKAADSITSETAAAGLMFARVDTASLTGFSGSAIGMVTTFFPHGLGGDESPTVAVRAVAGPTWVRATPLAICALENNATGTRDNDGLPDEKIEYGFRRGVSYNLLELSPNSTPGQVYMVNPIDPASGTSQANSFSDNVVKHFFCSGTMPMTSLGNGSHVHVSSLGSAPIHGWLNSRFNDGGAGCDAAKAPPDTNVREYVGATNTNWMPDTPDRAYAEGTQATLPDNSSRWVTSADLDPDEIPDPAPTKKSFGPLWTYSKPESTGTAYTVANFPQLYTFGLIAVSAGDSTKYGAINGAYHNPAHRTAPTAPLATPVAHRRVLNIPLLDCSGGNPDPGVAAKVIGIGRFFMTARAKSTSPASVPGEFAGALEHAPATRPVALFR